MSEERGILHIDEILRSIDWEKAWTEVPPHTYLKRIEDDSRDGFISVVFSCDGDAWVEVNPTKEPGMRRSVRFRVPGCGGGRSSRVRKALMVLAMAIKADNEGLNGEDIE